MKRLLPLLSGLALLLVFSAGGLHGQAAASPTPAIQTGGETAAAAAAEIWLGLVDDGRYEPSYVAAASIFQKLVSRELWTKLVTGGRAPLGKNLSRKFKDAKFSPTMPGAPDGQYVVVHYDSSFEKKAAATETLTTVLDSDGQWKVCGYYIR